MNVIRQTTTPLFTNYTDYHEACQVPLIRYYPLQGIPCGSTYCTSHHSLFDASHTQLDSIQARTDRPNKRPAPESDSSPSSPSRSSPPKRPKIEVVIKSGSEAPTVFHSLVQP